MFATVPRAVGFTIVCPEGVIFRSMMTYQAQFLLLVVAGWVNRQQQDVIDYLQEENRVLRAGLRGKRLRLSDDDRRRLAVKAQVLGREVLPRLRPLPHPLRSCAGTATSSQPSTMAVKTGAQADLRRRRTSVSSWYAWRGILPSVFEQENPILIVYLVCHGVISLITNRSYRRFGGEACVLTPCD